MHMKRIISGISAVLIFIAMLFFPKAVFTGAADGLLLWFQVVFPTLFPFMLISGVMLAGGGLSLISHIFGRLSTRLFATSSSGAFAVIAGFLCGYPMGAKISADLVRTGNITREEGCYLLSFCNNTSPVFIMNFIVWKTLGKEELMTPTLTILMSVPVILSIPFRKFYLKGKKRFPDVKMKSSVAGKGFDMSVFDSCMMESFESIVKVGGYIIIFSILTALLTEIPGNNFIILAIAPFLEMTNGIVLLNSFIPDLSVSYPLILGLASFGGLCAAAQTECMLGGSYIPICPYLMQKLAAAMAASLIGMLYIRLL